jgi:hypothetical protein
MAELIGLKTGVAWFEEADWPRVKALFPDADELHDTYAEWRLSVEIFIAELKQGHVEVERVGIDLDAFLNWCSARGVRPIASSRAKYVSELLKYKHQSQG